MSERKENTFQEKFKILNSQQHVEDINWSSNESSGYEDTSENVTKLSCLKNSRKRKRNPPKNLANLSVTFLDTSKYSKSKKSIQKSPILIAKTTQKSFCQSPILAPKSKNVASSPILTSSKSFRLKSPVLVSRTSPQCSVKVRKKLFEVEKNKEIQTEDQDIVQKVTQIIENTTKAKLDLIKRVSSFFDSNFSSENSQTSQITISDNPTPKNSKSSNEEIILTCKSETLPTIPKKEDLSSPEHTNITKIKRKKRYKKGGLVFRLNDLVKKQNSRLAIWQHEKFLAATTSFIIPKEEFLMFRIQKVEINYGCHFLQMVNENGESYSLLIHSSYISDTITEDCAIKLYCPFKILDIKGCKLIVNVSKFDCITYVA